ncbi:MAG: hypothetical protein AB1599_04285, partial [Planctomycetota bacterium]
MRDSAFGIGLGRIQGANTSFVNNTIYNMGYYGIGILTDIDVVNFYNCNIYNCGGSLVTNGGGLYYTNENASYTSNPVFTTCQFGVSGNNYPADINMNPQYGGTGIGVGQITLQNCVMASPTEVYFNPAGNYADTTYISNGRHDWVAGAIRLWGDYLVSSGTLNWNTANPSYTGGPDSGTAKTIRFMAGPSGLNGGRSRLRLDTGATLDMASGNNSSNRTQIVADNSGSPVDLVVSGTINANYYSLNNLSDNGLYLTNQAVSVTSLANGIFQNSAGISGSAHIRLNNSSFNNSITVSGCSFDNTTTYDLNVNIGAQTITMTNYINDTPLGGSKDYRVGSSNVVWQPNAFVSVQSGSWSNPATWGGSITPTIADNVTISAVHTVTITGSQVANSIQVNGGLILDSSSGAVDLRLQSNGVMTNSGTVTLTGANTITIRSQQQGLAYARVTGSDFVWGANAILEGIDYQPTMTIPTSRVITFSNNVRTRAVNINSGGELSHQTSGAIWTIDGGNVVVNGTLRLGQNTQTRIVCATDGQYGIRVQPNGSLYANGQSAANRNCYIRRGGNGRYFLAVYGNVYSANCNMEGLDSQGLAVYPGATVLQITNPQMTDGSSIQLRNGQDVTIPGALFDTSANPQTLVRAYGSATSILRFANYVNTLADTRDDEELSTNSIVIWGTDYVPDGFIRLSTETDSDYVSNNVYNTTGLTQTKSSNATIGTTVTYFIRVQNDGTLSDQYVFTGSTAPVNWTVSYFDALTGGNEIDYATITGAGWLNPSVVTASGGVTYIRVQVTPNGGASGTADIYVTGRSNGLSSRSDVVRCQTTVPPAVAYAVDNLVRTLTATSWAGDGIYNSNGDNQLASQTVLNNQSVTYYIQVQNEGTSNDTYTVSQSASPPVGWTVSYYDGGTPITLPYSLPLNSGVTRTLTAVVNADGTITPGNQCNLWLTSVSQGSGTVSDTVRYSTQLGNWYRTDNHIKTQSEGVGSYSGLDVYEDVITPTQSRTVNAEANQIASYTVRIENDGNVTNTMVVTGTAGGSYGGGNWAVTYYDNTSQENVTAQITQITGYNIGLGIGETREIRVEVSADTSVTSGTYYSVYVRTRSTYDSAMSDTVRADSYCGGYRPDLLASLPSPVSYIGDGVYANNSPPVGSPAQELSRVTDNNVLVSYYFRIQNDAGQSDTYSVTGSSGAAGWTVSYFDALVGGTNITTEMTNGIYTRTVGAGASFDYRVEVTPTGQPVSASRDTYITLYTVNSAVVYDAVRCRTLIRSYTVNNYIRVPSGSYVGADINPDGSGNNNQAQNLDSNAIIPYYYTPTSTVTYYVRITNESNDANSYTLTGTTVGSSQWTVSYYNVPTNTDITTLVSGTGYALNNITAGGNREIYTVISPTAIIPADSVITTYIRAYSSVQTAVSDTVRSVTTVSQHYFPDLHIKRFQDAEGTYVGLNNYDEGPSWQTVAVSTTISAGEVVSYHIRVENDGNFDSTYTLTGTLATGGWTVSYYDNLDNDQTVSFTGTGWVSQSIPAGSVITVTARVTHDGTPAPGVPVYHYIRIRDTQTGAERDTVKTSTIAQPNYQADNRVKGGQEPIGNYIGDGIYSNVITPTQTVSRSLSNNGVVSYHVALQNDTNFTETLTVTGSGAPAGWTITYYDAETGGSDITADILSGAYSRTDMAQAATYTIRIEVEAGSRFSLAGNSVFTATVLSKPQDSSDTARQDLVACVTTVSPNYTMDNLVSTPTDYATFAGNAVYNQTGSGQTDAVYTISPTGTVTYLVRIENDGNMDSPVTLTASGSSGGWTVTYHNGTSTADPVIPYGDITGAGWLRPDAITPSGLGYITVELRPGAGVLGGAAGEYICYLRTLNSQLPTITDTIRTRTQTNVFYRADNGISDNEAGPFADMTITSTNGTGQTITRTVATNAVVTYYIRLEHDGNSQNDTFSVTGTAGVPSNWAVTYYDAPTLGNNITAAITGSGWTWGPVSPVAYAPAQYQIIRAEVSPITTTSGAIYTLYTTIRSQGSGWSALDIVRANTICANYRPDLRYDTASAGPYNNGEDVYSDANPPLGSPAQDYTVYTDTDITVTYFIRLENDGDDDTYSLSGSGGSAQWTVSYYNAVSGGTDITGQVVNGIYTVAIISPTQYVDYRVEVRGNSAPPSTTRQTDVYLYSTSQFILYDRMRLNTVIRDFYADNWIKRSTDGSGSYIGNGVINTDGTNQTITNTLANNATVTYNITLQNDSNLSETITVTGSGATSGWTVSYYDGITDITADILSGAYSQVGIVSGATYAIRIEIIAGGGLAGNDTITNTILSQCSSNPSRQDMVRCVTSVIPDYTVDNRVALPPSYGTYEGDNSYNETGAGQTDTVITITPLSAITYSLRIENDGNMGPQITLTGSGNSGGWSVSYYDGIDTNATLIPYAQITSADGWLRPGIIAPGGFVNICVEISPDATVVGGAPGEYTNYVRVISNLDSTISDTIRTRTRTDVVYRADSGISNNAAGPYADMSITSTDGATQAVTQTIQTNATVTYYIRLENDGNVSDTFSITGTAGDAWWAVTYYDAETGGTNITGNMTGSGWVWGPVGPIVVTPTDFTIIRAEVTPLTTTSGATYALYPTLSSQGSGWSVRDVVRANTVCFNYRPDLRYDTVSAGPYTSGNGTYADSNPPLGSPTQDYSQYADSDVTVTYFVRVENDGSNDTFSLTASAPVASWTISYYNAVSGGTDVTAAMRNGTHTVAVASGNYAGYRVEVTGNSVISGNASAAYFYSYSTNSFSFYDAVRLTTTTRGYQADGMVKRGPDVSYIGDNITNTDGTNQTITNTLTNSQMVSYHIRVQNDGNTTQDISVSGSPAASGWTISYYDAESGGSDITVQILAGAYSQSGIAVGGVYTIRLEVTAGDRLNLAGGSVLTNTVRTRPLNTSAGEDVVRCATEVISDYTIDNLVALSPTYASYDGDNVYNSTGSGQTDTVMSIPADGTITYLVKIENDGNVSTQVTLTGTPTSGGWSVTYYDGTNTAAPVIPYSQITSAQGWLRSGSIAPAGTANICVELKPDNTVLGGATGQYTGYARVISVANPSNADTIRTRTQTQVFYRADSGIRNPSEGTYADMTITSTNGTGQTKSQSILSGGMVTYYIRVENDGNATDVFSITGTGSNTEWSISYYDAETAGNNITTQITGIGWPASALSPVAYAPAQYQIIRAELKVLTTTPGASYTMYLTARSQGSGYSAIDVVRSDTTLSLYRPDLHIKRSTDPGYTIGLNEYEPAVQTSDQQAAATGQVVTFYVRVENDGGVDSVYRLTGTGSGSGWTVVYYDLFGNITSQMTGAGYDTDTVTPGDSREIRVEIFHDGTPPGGTPYYHYIRARAVSEPTEADTVRTATVTPDYQPDNLVALPSGYVYEGDNTYNLTGSGQSNNVVNITALSTVSYMVKIVNDGNSATNVTVTGSWTSGGWTITYYELPGGTQIPNGQITGSGWVINNLTMGSSKEIRVEASPDSSVLAGAAGEKTIYVKSIAANNPSQSDTVKAGIRTNIMYRADNGISSAAGGPYADLTITSTDGTNQTVQQNTSSGGTVTYYIRIENDGNTDDTLSVTGMAGTADWAVTYYDNQSGGSNITGQVTGSGWSYGPMSPVGYAPAQYKIIRVEVKAITSTIGAEYQMLISAISKNSGYIERDVVKATTRVQPYYQPDLQVKEQSEGSYTGNNYYTNNPSGQSLALKYVNNSQTITYHIKIENDGLNDDTFIITGWSGGASGSWNVAYYDALAGGVDITSQIISGTPTSYSVWLAGNGGTTDIRVEVTPGANVKAHDAGSPNILLVKVRATSNTDGSPDELQTQTAVNKSFKPDGFIRASTESDTVPGSYAGYDEYYPTSQMKQQGANNNGTITYYVRVQNDGNYSDTFSITGTATGSAGGGTWTVRYYNQIGTNITAAVTLNGYSTSSFGEFQSGTQGQMFRVEVSPDGNVAQGTVYDVSFGITSKSDMNKKDITLAQSVLNNYQPDLYIRQSIEGYNNGRDNNVYEPPGASQAVGPTNIDSDTYITYYVKVENDSSTGASDRVTLTGTAATAGWSISYYTVPTGTNITSAINGSGWLSDVVTAGGYAEIYVEVRADSTQKGLSKDIYVEARSSNSSAKSDQVKASININVNYQADMMITATNPAGFIGNDTWNSDGTGQTVNQTANNNQTITYYIRLQNDGDAPDKFTLTGSAAPSGWSVTYYDGAGNITSQMTTGPGWYDAAKLDLAVGASYTIRAEVTPSGTVTGTSQAVLYITGISQGSTAKKDVVRAICEVNSSYTVNNWVGATTGTYNTVSAAQNADNSQVVTYYIKVENTGNTNNTVTITGTGADSNWYVTYYDAPSGTNDITGQITGGTYQPAAIAAFGYTEIRVQAEAKIGALGASSKILSVQSRSTGTGNPTDNVTGTTTVNNSYTVNNWVGLTTGTYNTSSAGQTANNSQTVTYYIKLENTGNTDNTVTVSGAAGDANWAVIYYDAPTGTNDITGQITGGTYQPADIGAFGFKEIRVEVTANAGLGGSSAKALAIEMRSVDDPTKSDNVTATTTTNNYSVNNWVGVTTGTYNTTSASQGTDNDAGQAVTYYIRIDNTGDMPNTVTITGAGSDSNWTVSYYDAPTGTNDITTQVIAGAYQPAAIAVSGNKEIRVEVKPSVQASGAAQKALVIEAKSTTLPNPSDTVTATTTVSQRYKVDSQIARLSELPGYTGNNTYEAIPTAGQTKTDNVSNNQTQTYYVQLENDGNMTERFSLSKGITATGSASQDWSITYYNEIGADITSNINSGSWLSNNLSWSVSEYVRVEITPNISVTGGSALELVLTGQSTLGVSSDGVRITITCLGSAQPDMMITSTTGAAINQWDGYKIYNTTAVSQTINRIVTKADIISYYVRIYNDGNNDDTYTITGASSSGSWIVTYYDGAIDVTSSVAGAGWTPAIAMGGYKEVTIYINAPDTAEVGTDVTMMATSQADITKQDALKITLLTGGVWAQIPPTEPPQNGDPVPEVNLENKTVGQRPVIIGRTSTGNYGKVVTLVDIEGRTVGSGVSDATEGYYRIEVTVDLPITMPNNSITPYVEGITPGATINLNVVANPTATEVPQMVWVTTGNNPDIDVTGGITPTIRPIGGKIKIKGNAKPNSPVVVQMASKLDLNVGSTVSDGAGYYEVENDDPLIRGLHTFSIVCDGVVSNLIALNLVDPAGKVFDSVTGQVIEGAVVELQYEAITGSNNWVTPVATDIPAYLGVITPTPPGGTTGTNPQTIGNSGFSWGAAEGLTFRLRVLNAPGYTFPSTQTSWQIPWTGMGYTDTGVVSGTALAFRGGSFIQPATPVQIDIPVDPTSGILKVTKTANKSEVTYGDVVTYDVKIENNNAFNVSDVALEDIMPAGLKYLDGSGVMISGTAATQTTPVSAGAGAKRFGPVTLTGNASVTYRYQLAVGAGVVFGEYKNTARAVNNTTSALLSNNSKVRVMVAPDPLFDYATIIGKVFNDANGDGLQGEGENGLAGIKIMTEDGITVITDKDGKYHIAGLRPSTRLLKIDTNSLPLNTKFTTAHPGIVRFTGGGRLEKMNFGLQMLKDRIVGRTAIMAEISVNNGIPEIRLGGEKVPLKWSNRPRGVDQAEVVVEIQGEDVGISAGTPVKQEIILTEDNKVKIWARDSSGREVETEYRVTIPRLEVTVKREIEQPVLVPELGIALTPEILEVRQGKLIRQARFKIVTNYAGFVENWKLQILEKTDERGQMRGEGYLEKCAQDAEPAESPNMSTHPEERIPDGYRVFKEFTGTRADIEKAIAWDGKGNDGRMVEENRTYKYLLTLADSEGRTDTSVLGQFMVQTTWTKAIKDALGISAKGGPTGQPGDIFLPINAAGIKDKEIPVAGRLYRVSGTTDPSNTVIISTANTPNITTVKPLEDGRFETELYLPVTEEQVIVEVTSKGNLKRKLLTSDIRIEKEKEKYLFFAGLADVMAGSNTREGDEVTLDALADNNVRYNKGTYTQYRLAGFLKMRNEDWTIAGSVDSDRVTMSHEQRQLFRYLDPDKFYPMYGDSSTRIDEASNTQGPLYLKAEHRNGYNFLVGNYNTNVSGSELAQYNRSLYGFQGGYQTPSQAEGQANRKTNLSLFVASANQMASRDEIRGTGGSLYYLKNKNVREGSEKITVETRDKVSGITVSARVLKAFEDYEIDYTGGRIILTHPLHSVAASESIISTEPLEGNPVYLAIDYEYEPERWWDFNREALGTRIVKNLDNFTIGATYVKEEKDLTDYTLMGTDITAKLGKYTDAKLEYAKSESEGIPGYISYNGGLDYASLPTASNADGVAYKLNVGMDIGALLNKNPGEIMGKTYYASTEAGFSSNATISQQGSEKMGLEVGAKLSDNDTLLTRFDSQTVLDGANAAVQNTAGAQESQTLVLQIAHRQDPLRVTGEYRYQDTPSPYITPGLLRDETSQILAARAEYDVNKDLSVFGEQQAALAGKPNNQTTVGANMKVSENITGNIQQTFGTLGSSTMFGLTTNIKEETEKHSLYTNYQITQDAQGQQNYNVVIGEKEQVSEKLNVYRENRFSARRGAEEGNFSGLFGTNYKLSGQWLMNATYERSQVDNLS